MEFQTKKFELKRGGEVRLTARFVPMLPPNAQPKEGSTGVAVKKELDDRPFHYISLLPKANLKLLDSIGPGLAGDNLADLPRGEQTFAKKAFKIEDGVIQLSGGQAKLRPTKVEGITVNRKFANLNILHGTYFGARGVEGDPSYAGDGTTIGEYTIHYEDKTTIPVPIVYGKDVRDLWEQNMSKGITRGVLGWEGTSTISRRTGETLRLYVTTWENPYPPKMVTHIDYQSTNSACAPFCIAMTAGGGATPRPDFYYDFRKGNAADTTFAVLGPDAPGRMTYDLEGLRIALPAKRENNAALCVVTRSRIRGDFEITVGYQLLHTDQPKKGIRGVGFEVYLMTDTATREATAFYREVYYDGSEVYSGVRMTTSARGDRVYVGGASFKPLPAAGKSGQRPNTHGNKTHL